MVSNATGNDPHPAARRLILGGATFALTRGSAMAVQTGSRSEALRAKRDQYVARGVAIAPVFADHAHGATLVDKRGMGPFAPEIYRATAPYPYRGIGAQDALDSLDWMFKATVDPASVACMILEPVQGEGGFTVMPPEFVQGLMERCEAHGI